MTSQESAQLVKHLPGKRKAVSLIFRIYAKKKKKAKHEGMSYEFVIPMLGSRDKKIPGAH